MAVKFDIPNSQQVKLWAKILIWALIYYLTSALSGVYNKWLVDGKTFSVSPTFLTWFHLIVALCSDAVIMRSSAEETLAREQLSQQGGRTALDVVVAFTPIALFVILSKLMTYVSYQYVSVALSHTAKASEPIFNVIVAAVVFGEYHSPAVYASLLPITLGIAMASVSELSYNHYGFAIAAFSALMKVLQNIYTKKLMNAAKWTFWEVHLYCGAASLVMMLPLMYFSWVKLQHAPYSGSLPVFGLLVDAILQWASSVSAYVVLSLVAHLTATIINTFKRVVMITSGSMFDPSAAALTPFNLVGVLLATAGIFLYNMVKDSEYLQQQIQIGMGKATQTLGLHLPLPAWLDAWAEKQTGLPMAGAASPGPMGGSAGAATSSAGGDGEGFSASSAVFWVKRTVTRLIITFVPADHWLLGRLSLYSRSSSVLSMRRPGVARTSPAPSGGGSKQDVEAAIVGVDEGGVDDGLSDAGSGVGIDGAGEGSLLTGVGWSSATAAVSGTLRSTAVSLAVPPDRGVAGWAHSQHHAIDRSSSSSHDSVPSGYGGGMQGHGHGQGHAQPGWPVAQGANGHTGYRAPLRVGVAGGAGAVPLQDATEGSGSGGGLVMGGRRSRTGSVPSTTAGPGSMPPGPASPLAVQGKAGTSSPYMLMGSPVPMTPMR